MREDIPDAPEGHECSTCSDDGHCEIQDRFKVMQMISQRFTMIVSRIDPRLMAEPPTRALH